MAGRVFFFVAVTAFFLCPCSLAKSTVLLQPQDHATDPEFGYSGNTGPDQWGTLSPKYAACSAGKSQSPIDIVTAKAILNKSLKVLKRHYYPVNATLINHQHNIGILFGNAGVMIVDGKSYNLQQIHWHSPSEHKINGVPFDAELHLVHKATDGSISVIAVLHKIGRADAILAKIQKQLVELLKESEIPIGTFDTKTLRINTHKYFKYVGSLTTPPCSENVIWHVSNKVRSMSEEQLRELQAPLSSTCKRNCRPIQPLNGRQVQLFGNLRW